MTTTGTVRTSVPPLRRLDAANDTPPTDREYQITEQPRQPFQVHWFTGTAYLSLAEVGHELTRLAGANLLEQRFGRMGYRRAHQAVEFPGLTVLSDPGDPDNMPPVCIVVPGESCEALGWQRLQQVTAPFKPTRVDLAFDDFPFTPQEVKELILSDQVRTRAQRHTLKWHEDYSTGALGETVTIGGRGSNNFFRCYNSRGFDRGELELKGDLATSAYELLQAPIDQAREMAISFLRRFIEFVDNSSSTNKTRQDPLPRWVAWYQHVQKALIDLPARPVPTLQRAWTWFERQLAPMVSLLAEHDLTKLHEKMHEAEARWTDRHRLMLGSV